MKYLDLHVSVERCRPEAPLTQLHNDCGAQDRCARRIAAITRGEAHRDFSKSATPYAMAMLCSRFISFSDAATAHEDATVKRFPGVSA